MTDANEIKRLRDGLERKWKRHNWKDIARPSQLAPPGDWNTWLIMAGRGFGKTRAGAEWVRHRVITHEDRRIALVARTDDDARRTMIEGESGILAVCPPWNTPIYRPSRRELTWPNGASAFVFSSQRPDQLRGPQFDSAWCDELAAWIYPRQTWDNLAFATRLGQSPRTLVTTTPRPIPLMRQLMRRDGVALTRGSSYENADNLAPDFLAQLSEIYEGTNIGRQEIHAEILDESERALWKRQWIEDSRVKSAPDLVRIVVSIDPAMSSDPRSDETGIIAAGADPEGHAYVLADASGRFSPDGWAKRAISLYRQLKADRIIAEANNGGELVHHTLRIASEGEPIPFMPVHAGRGKFPRAEPVSALYEQRKVHHVGAFPKLEDQMCDWTPGSPNSPDRLDALVWAITQLIITHRELRIY